MKYCDRTMYVTEVLLANPHKFGEETKEPLRQHAYDCDTCQATIEEARDFANMMDREFEY